jgi:uncharacterized coiled-coil DUF342 family protein
VPTRELIGRIEQMQASISSQAKARHELNNRLMVLLGTHEELVAQGDRIAERTVSHMRTLHEHVGRLDAQMVKMQKQVTELDHLLRGVDGNNGMRSDLKEIRTRIRYLELRVFALCALVGGGAFGLSKLV